MPSIFIQNGTLLDPSTNTQEKLNLLIENGRITQRAAGFQPSTKPDHVIDAAGKFVCPGLIDIHVHFREPGDEEEETIASGAAAAVAGGFTTVCVMPNTKPAIDNAAQIEFVLRESERLGLCNVLPTGCITKSREGIELAEMADMHRRGAVAFTDDGAGINDTAVMRKAFQYIKMFDGLVMQHCEDEKLGGGAMHAGVVSTSLGLPGVPAEAEQLMIARDVLLNRTIGCRYHVQHISTAFSVELIRRAKKDGLPVTAEVAPHHLLLTDEDCRGYDTNFKMNPPLRTAADVAACIAGVVDGTIDLLATDHAPHRAEEKELEFAKAPNGIIGLEGAMALYAQALVHAGHINWLKLIDMMSTQPAKLIRSTRGTLQVGRAADVTVIDPDAAWTIDKHQFRSKSRNCPFHGRQVKGRPTHTIVGGKLVWALEAS